MAMASVAGGWAAPKSDILVQAWPGSFPATTSALRLETSDIDDETHRWSRLAEKVCAALLSLTVKCQERCLTGVFP